MFIDDLPTHLVDEMVDDYDGSHHHQPPPPIANASAAPVAAGRTRIVLKRGAHIDPAVKHAIEVQRALSKAEKRRRRRATVKYRTLHASRER